MTSYTPYTAAHVKEITNKTQQNILPHRLGRCSNIS